MLNELIQKDNQLPPEKRYMTREKRDEFWNAFFLSGQCGFHYYSNQVKEEIDRRLAEHNRQREQVGRGQVPMAREVALG